MYQKLFVSLTIFFALSSPAYSIDAKEAKEVANELSLEVMSPYCPGRSLRDCPSVGSTDLREEIYRRVLAGESKQKIKDELYVRFEKEGVDIRAIPEFAGFGSMVWIGPAIFLLIGFFVLTFWLRKNKTNKEGEAKAS